MPTTRRVRDRLGDVFAPACPSRGVLDHVTSRWGVLVLVALTEHGTLRFSVLRRKIGGVTEKMLAQTLVNLEHDGFVSRTQYPEIPPRVEYALTPLGRAVAEKVEALADWVEQHLPEVQEARAKAGAPTSAAAMVKRVSSRPAA